jgi:hypothetical protein
VHKRNTKCVIQPYLFTDEFGLDGKFKYKALEQLSRFEIDKKLRENDPPNN